MVEAYSFLAAFPFQILMMSVLMPAWFISYARRQAASIPPERLRRLYPGIDHRQALERYLSRYRTVNIVIALLGVPLLIWFFVYMKRVDWTDGPVEALITAYFMAQSLPFGYVIFIAAKHSDVIKNLSEPKRSALLERRGLFDFVSPSMVALAALAYFLFAGYLYYIAQNPFPNVVIAKTIGAVTLVYVVNSIAVYWTLYGQMPNPYEPRASRARTIGLGVKACVYSCVAVVFFVSLNLTLVRLDLQRWEPFALSVLFVICALLCASAFAPPRHADADRLAATGHR
jgi:hypothetical protein